MVNLQLLNKEMHPDQDKQRSTSGDQSNVRNNITDDPDELTKNLIDKIPGGSDIE